MAQSAIHLNQFLMQLFSQLVEVSTTWVCALSTSLQSSSKGMAKICGAQHSNHSTGRLPVLSWGTEVGTTAGWMHTVDGQQQQQQQQRTLVWRCSPPPWSAGAAGGGSLLPQRLRAPLVGARDGCDALLQFRRALCRCPLAADGQLVGRQSRRAPAQGVQTCADPCHVPRLRRHR